ncbi:MAG: LysM peptidoglycan-binding domain-containing protein [Candidatus Spechtbacteria bacterium]|nr:LysM peptidoglycan-binding domain-containing protein [Candidatus Spechtbacteria bacterium]
MKNIVIIDDNKTLLEHKELHRKARLFSASTLAAVISSVVIVSLFINLGPGKAAGTNNIQVYTIKKAPASTTVSTVSSTRRAVNFTTGVDAYKTGMSASIVLGQPDFTSSTVNNGGVSANSLNSPSAVEIADGKMVVADSSNNRILIWNSVPNSSTPADLVLGQPNFTSNTANNGGISASTLNGPQSVIYVGGRLFIADSSNNRILIWNSVPNSSTPADLVLGQPNFTSNTANNGGLSASTFGSIWDVASDGTKLAALDPTNNRILIWNSLPTVNQQAADVVLGNSIFTTALSNTASAKDFQCAYTCSIDINNGKLFLMDKINARVLIWNSISTVNYTSADVVIGQPDFTTATNNIFSGTNVVSSKSTRWPSGAYSDGQRLFISDHHNHRIMVFNSMPTSNYAAADIVIGQTSMDTSNGLANGTYTGSITAFNTNSPSKPVYYNGNLIVPDSGNNRILIFPSTVATSAIASTPSTTSSSITYNTNSLTSTKADYGLTDQYGSTTSETDTSPRVMSHTVSLSSLVACTTYHYRTRATDATATEDVSSDNTFTTTGCTASAPVTAETASAITTAAGGTVALTSNNTGISLAIPAAFTGTDANIQVKKIDATTVFRAVTAPSGYSGISTYTYDLKALSGVGTSVTTFNNPITITMTYTDADIPPTISQHTLKIHRYDGVNWNELTGCTVNSLAKTVTCTTTSFSTFALFGSTSSSSLSSCSNIQPGSILPQITKAEAQSTTSILLTIQDGSDPISNYYLQYGTSPNSYSQGLFNIGAKGVGTYIVSSLTPNTTYYFVIASANDCVTGAWSKEVSATTTLAVIKPESPVETPSVAPSTTPIESPPAQTVPTQTEVPSVQTEETAEKEVPSAPSVSINTCQSYIVKVGDSLWSLAARFLGSGLEYKTLAKQNVSSHRSLKKNYDIIWIGWRLKIGCE